MKSTEEKAKLYDEAIEKLRKFYRDYDTVSCLIDVKKELANLFPELKESEDERIRKEIVETLNYANEVGGILNDVKCREYIAWLEKQGEQKPAKYTLEQAAGIFLDALSNTPYNNKPITDAQVITKELLKFLADTNSYNPNAINEQNLWTIQDAKDGDVLAENKGDMILMFRRIGNTKWDDVIDYHCYYSCYLKKFNVQKDLKHWGKTEDCQLKPATKEQRDLLFAKMKEAGYKWDAEKKQLNKIEKKPAWNEEDKMHIRELESLVKQAWTTAEYKNDKDTIHKMGNLLFFLKTLKPQLKQD